VSIPGPLGTHTRQLAVIGYPIAHSISPAMHIEAFRHQRMNCNYSALAVTPADLGAAIEGLRALGFIGVNVTIPHKEAVLPLLDEVAPTARQVGAVNTIVNRGGRLIGYNTDGWGFISSLEEAGIRPQGMPTVIFGAGGASRAIVIHLALAGVQSITISNRTIDRAEALARDARTLVPQVPIRAVQAGGEEERQALIDALLVVNCTPLGMHPDTGGTPLADVNLLQQRATVYDTVFRPAETRLLREARVRGVRAVGGLGMLVHQGACAWEYWFGRRGPVKEMYNAARLALEGRR
jgi:shikimate dehydrogenase